MIHKTALIFTLILAGVAQAPAQDIDSIILIQLELLRLREQPAILKIDPKPKVNNGYAEAYARSVSSGRPLVIGVGVDPPKGIDWDTVNHELPYFRWNTKAVIITVPEGNNIYNIKELPPNATWDQIQDAYERHQGKRIIDGFWQRHSQLPVQSRLENC